MIETVSKIVCPHCGQESAPAEFCSHCGRILPEPESQSYYEVLGYDREILTLDPGDLERRLFALSKKFHPDRFATRTPQEMQISQDRSSAINNAYRILKDPGTRAKYIVEKELGSIEEKSAKVPAEMADLFFEIHDILDTIRESEGVPPESAVREVQDAQRDLIAKVRELEADLQNHFLIYDQSHDRQIVERMKEILSERSYIKSFLRQIDVTLRGEGAED